MSYWYGRGYGRCMDWLRGAGWGRGNPYPYCRWNPNLPRGWWRFPPEILEQWGFDPSSLPYSPDSGWQGPWYPSLTPDQEKKILKTDIEQIEKELAVLQKRLTELEKKKQP
ncbi:MAG: hypothetical protein ACFFAE_13880 [Candidatus Hodarchaeota archaeon]